MNELTAKYVNFNGDNLLAVQDETGKIHVAVYYICKGLGLDDNQTKTQRDKINSDVVLSKGGRKISIPTNGGYQDVLCLELNFLPMWLAKINANIISDHLVQDKLVEYQLKAKDVLSQAFIQHEHIIDPSKLSPELQLLTQMVSTMAKQELAIKNAEQIAKDAKADAEEAKGFINGVKDAMAELPRDQWRSWVNSSLTAMVASQECQFNHEGIRNHSYDLLEKRAGADLSERVRRAKKRLSDSGATKTSIEAYRKLDAIENDKRLKEIYTGIIRELRIKFLV